MVEESPSVTIRAARETDHAALAEVAALDSARVPSPPVLVAEVGGVLMAAVGVCSGERIANPFLPTASLLELLSLRARRLADADHDRPWRRSLRHRAPAAARTA